MFISSRYSCVIVIQSSIFLYSSWPNNSVSVPPCCTSKSNMLPNCHPAIWMSWYRPSSVTSLVLWIFLLGIISYLVPRWLRDVYSKMCIIVQPTGCTFKELVKNTINDLKSIRVYYISKN